MKKQLQNTKAAAIDKKELQEAKARKEALKKSPNTDDLIPVYIDDKTTMFIKPGEDPELKKAEFFRKHEMLEA